MTDETTETEEATEGDANVLTLVETTDRPRFSLKQKLMVAGGALVTFIGVCVLVANRGSEDDEELEDTPTTE